MSESSFRKRVRLTKHSIVEVIAFPIGLDRLGQTREQFHFTVDGSAREKAESRNLSQYNRMDVIGPAFDSER